MASSTLKTKAKMDASELCEDSISPGFFEWADGMDAAANKVDIRREGKDWKKPSIYRVTSFARSHNPNAFTPQVISFGPFHHGDEHLKVTEMLKQRALTHFLHRAEKPLRTFISKLRCILKQLQDSYQDLDDNWKQNPYEFLKMMLLDGCFMLEVLRLKDEGSKDYAPNDPVFSLQMMHLRFPYIKRDLLLLENQLPLLVLKALLEVEDRGQNGDQYINNLVLKFCGEELKANSPGLASHPLELYRMSMLHGCDEHKIVECEQGKKCKTAVMQHAVELRESGVQFETSKSGSLMNIQFDPKKGVLKLPAIPVDDGTEHLFLNLIAYEQIHVGTGNEITSYIMFMDALIDSGQDVKLLQKTKIISNSRGSHEAIADLFNTLSKEAAHDPNDPFNQTRYDIIEFYENRRNRWGANLRHQYLHSPWKVISIFAASFAIFLTFIQTVYAVLGFHLPKGS